MTKTLLYTGHTKVQGLDPAKHKNSINCEDGNIDILENSELAIQQLGLSLITGLNFALTNILEKENGMGKVRPDYIKKLARKLVERFPKRFNSDFENNKRMVAALTDVTSTKIRNRVAGYVTRLAKTIPDQNSVEND